MTERRPLGVAPCQNSVRHNALLFRQAVANMQQTTFDWLAGTHALMAEHPEWRPSGLTIIDEAGPMTAAMWSAQDGDPGQNHSDDQADGGKRSNVLDGGFKR